MSDFDFGVNITGADEAIRTMGRIESANQQAARGSEQASQRMKRGSEEAARGVERLGQSTQQMGQRTGQVVGALGQMTTQLGSLAGLSQTAGSAISQMGGAVGALSSSMGPLGVALGVATLAITALRTAINYEADSARDAAEAASAQASALRGLASAAREARAAVSQAADIAGGQMGSIGGETLQQRAEESRQRIMQMQRDFASGDSRGRGLQERVVNGRGALSGRTIEEMMPDDQRAEITRLRAEVAAIDAELQRRDREAVVAQDAASADRIAAGVRSEAALAERTRRQHRGGGTSPLDENLAGLYARQEAMDRQLREQEQRAIESYRFLEEAEKEHQAEMLAAAQATADEQKRLDEERARAALERQKELAEAAQTASRAFADSWRGSLEDVIDSFREANGALKASGGGILSTAELMRVGMRSVANEIADVVGGTMVGAFEQALGAWLDGSKSFVEAAEEMVKGVLKALVIESIVQAVTETARAIADLASYRYDSAALHFAAAAAWGAVGGVAGAVGAGIGAFGGGSDKGAGSATAPTPTDASTTAQPQQSLVLNVYPGGYITNRDVQRGIVDALDEAYREGVRPSFMSG